jgi:hypothetical protein
VDALEGGMKVGEILDHMPLAVAKPLRAIDTVDPIGHSGLYFGPWERDHPVVEWLDGLATVRTRPLLRIQLIRREEIPNSFYGEAVNLPDLAR